jgi:hypothetical protein
MKDAALAMAFMRYLLDPTPENIEATVVALEGRPDLPITPDQLRKAMVDNVAEVKRQTAGSSLGQAGTLMQRLLSKGSK